VLPQLQHQPLVLRLELELGPQLSKEASRQFSPVEQQVKIILERCASDAIVHGPQLIVDILALRLAYHILDDVDDKLRLRKDHLLQLLAVLPRARAIVQHQARGVQEPQRPVHVLLVSRRGCSCPRARRAAPA
jgi:hypothetical protein